MYSGTKIAKASHLRPYTHEDSPLIVEKRGSPYYADFSHPAEEEVLSPRRKRRPSVVVFPYPGT